MQQTTSASSAPKNGASPGGAQGDAQSERRQVGKAGKGRGHPQQSRTHGSPTQNRRQQQSGPGGGRREGKGKGKSKGKGKGSGKSSRGAQSRPQLWGRKSFSQRVREAAPQEHGGDDARGWNPRWSLPKWTYQNQRFKSWAYRRQEKANGSGSWQRSG